MKISTDPAVAEIFDKYPIKAKADMIALRKLVMDTAGSMDNLSYLKETLKWGEPSYLTNIGSTLRMDWKAKNPDQYSLYFQCNSRLVDTFKVIFGDTFTYEGRRALIFDLGKPIPQTEVQECIKAALQYHRVKDSATLGI